MDDPNLANQSMSDDGNLSSSPWEFLGDVAEWSLEHAEEIEQIVNGLGQTPGIAGPTPAPGGAVAGGTPRIVGAVVRDGLIDRITPRVAGAQPAAPSSPQSTPPAAPDATGMLTLLTLGGVLVGAVVIGGVLILRPL